MTRSPFIPLLAFAMVAYLATGIYAVRADERAVVRRFGRVVSHPGPGLHFGLPWGIERVDRVRVLAVRQLSVGGQSPGDDTDARHESDLLTGDQNLVGLRLVVEYTAGGTDSELDDYSVNGALAEWAIGRTTEAAAAEWVAGRPVDEVLLTGRTELPVWLSGRLLDRLSPQRLGVNIGRVSVEHLAPPPEVRAAFDAVAQAQAGIDSQVQQARQQSETIRQSAEATRFRLGRVAEAYRRDKISAAAVEAEAFTRRSEQYHRLRRENPNVLTAIWWSEIGRTLLGMKGQGRLDILDSHLGPDGLDVTRLLPIRK